MSFFSKIFLIFIFFFSFNSNIFAATGPEEIPELKEKVYFEVYPTKPNLGDTVNIEAQMYGTEIKDSEFIWSMNGKIIKQGAGANRVDFTLDEKTKIDITIKTGKNITIKNSFDFDPKKVVLIWESKTYTPPFYKGKSFYSEESSLVLNAINLDQENPLTNINNNYVWKIDSTVKGSQSGVGYNTFFYPGDILGLEPLFSVTMSSIKLKDNSKNNTFNNESLLRVQSLPTEIISFEKSPLLGVMFNKTVQSTYNFNKNETTIVSYPMNYSLSSSLAGTYEWYINDNKINTNLNQISFKRKNDGDKSRLTLKVINPNSILQTINKSYIIDTSEK